MPGLSLAAPWPGPCRLPGPGRLTSAGPWGGSVHAHGPQTACEEGERGRVPAAGPLPARPVPISALESSQWESTSRSR